MPQEVHDSTYYAKCMMGGILSCGITHTAVCPLDIVKCRRQVSAVVPLTVQVDPTLYKSVGDGFRTIYKNEGMRGLSVGWLPTFIGYSMQGFGKFGFYEIFKDVYRSVDPEQKYQTLGFALSSASAEVIADVLLCPMETVKVAMQTRPAGTFPLSMSPALEALRKENPNVNPFYKIITPLWFRQVPYTVVKFVAFEKTVRFMYRNVFTAPKETYSKATQLGVTFLSGYWAGIFCAIVSHPSDTMVSKLNNHPGDAPVGAKVKEIYGEIGFAGLWRGLGARIIMIGTLTGLQWWIYDTFKVATGLQAAGGK